MRIRSIDHDVDLEIVRGGFEHPVDIDISIEGRGFSGANYNIFPQNTYDFVQELAELEKTRKGQTTLYGTEDFKLHISAIGGIGEISVDLELSRSVCFSSSLGPKRYEFQLKIGFPVGGEYVPQLVSGFRDIFAQKVY